MSQRHCRACGGWHELDLPWPDECADHFRRPRGPAGDFPAPNVVSDQLADLDGPGGRKYSSKRALRRAYRAHGLVELGNDAPIVTRDNRKRITKAEIGAAYQKVKQGYKPKRLETSILPPE